MFSVSESRVCLYFPTVQYMNVWGEVASTLNVPLTTYSHDHERRWQPSEGGRRSGVHRWDQRPQTLQLCCWLSTEQSPATHSDIEQAHVAHCTQSIYERRDVGHGQCQSHNNSKTIKRCKNHRQAALSSHNTFIFQSFYPQPKSSVASKAALQAPALLSAAASWVIQVFSVCVAWCQSPRL